MSLYPKNTSAIKSPTLDFVTTWLKETNMQIGNSRKHIEDMYTWIIGSLWLEGRFNAD